ncbi:hypothetical protein ACOSQ3_024818 [Xanthoceras sorbifolium]
MERGRLTVNAKLIVPNMISKLVKTNSVIWQRKCVQEMTSVALENLNRTLWLYIGIFKFVDFIDTMLKLKGYYEFGLKNLNEKKLNEDKALKKFLEFLQEDKEPKEDNEDGPTGV